MHTQESMMLASQRMGSEFPVLFLVTGAFAFDSKYYSDNIPHHIFCSEVLTVQMCTSYKYSHHLPM